MKILILENDTYRVESKDAPEVGRYYNLEDAVTGTAAQNKSFHALLNNFWLWMFKNNKFQFDDNGIIYNLSTPDQASFKDFFKYKYGQGFKHYQYVNKKFAMVKVKTMEEIPDYVIHDFNDGNKERVKGILKSWVDYTKKQRLDCIDMLLTIIYISECDDKKVNEIIDGMQREKQNET